MSANVGWKGERRLAAEKNKNIPSIEQIIWGHEAALNPHANKLAALAKERFPGAEEFTKEFLDDLLRISQTILRGLAIAMDLEEDFFIKVRPDYSSTSLLNFLGKPSRCFAEMQILW